MRRAAGRGGGGVRGGDRAAGRGFGSEGQALPANS